MDKQIRRKKINIEKISLIGMSWEEISRICGANAFLSDSQVSAVIHLKRHWLSRKKVLYIEFDENGKADTVILQNSNEI